MTDLTNKRSYEELQAICERLEAESGRHLVIQRDLSRTKDRLDRELMRFKAIQKYISDGLEVANVADFNVLTLESIIEAFEFEVALVLRTTNDPSSLVAAGEFGFDDPPGLLPFSIDWIDPAETRIFDASDALLENWRELQLAQAIVSPLTDKSGNFNGAVLAGITLESADFFEPITEEHKSAFSVLVQQASALWTNRELNEDIKSHNERLVDLTSSYSRFVPFQFLELLNRESIEEIGAGDAAGLEMNVLFADIRGFTTMSEKLGPQGAFAMLNEFLAVVEPAIEQENGFVNQYQGDAIMALFPGDADAALRCAVTMLKETQALNVRRKSRGEDEIRFGIGITSGPLMLGAIGGGQRLESNVVGDTANLSARTESMTKLFGAQILFTSHTMERLIDPGKFEIRELDQVVVVGRETAVTVYELMDMNAPDLKTQKQQIQAQFEKGLEHYRIGEFLPACKRFEACVALAPDDQAAALYIERCRGFVENPPVGGWNGLTVLGQK
ncbi:MAG: adenylate/guanylate cyclase domain-containing protein [Alphaproteobacteria bacterium]|nr:adenylate/guanylate cyclase domain-containing protein [Alphaproteobacteria bacterium]MBT4018210.1 adenylate/guanylate cyclase domain-containing protein [Alphaproteobacteria bacterium]MBT5160743.1 adenylate/guanylate cyclase domain-containing protein [Alphaproteobacteria bacterium]